MSIDRALLDELISCKKQIDKVEPRQEKSQNNHRQQIMKVSWGWYFFEIFTRRNEDLPMNFSVWLIWKWPEQNIYLCRYNWDHWEHRNPDGHKIRGFHKHFYNIKKGEDIPDDAYAIECNDYSTLEQALYQLCKDYNIDYKDKLDDKIQPWALFNYK